MLLVDFLTSTREHSFLIKFIHVLQSIGLKLKNRVRLSVLIQPSDEPAFGLERRELDTVLAFIVEHFSGLGYVMNVHNEAKYETC